MEIRSFSINYLKKKAVEIRLSILNSLAGAGKGHIGAEPYYSFELGKYFKGAAEIHPGKVGRFTVGTNIPIVHEDDAKQDADVFFVPSFGFKDIFVEKEKEWIDKGGTMIFEMTDVEIIRGNNK